MAPDAPRSFAEIETKRTGTIPICFSYAGASMLKDLSFRTPRLFSKDGDVS